jgi:hypothetical protein
MWMPTGRSALPFSHAKPIDNARHARVRRAGRGGVGVLTLTQKVRRSAPRTRRRRLQLGRPCRAPSLFPSEVGGSLAHGSRLHQDGSPRAAGGAARVQRRGRRQAAYRSRASQPAAAA